MNTGFSLKNAVLVTDKIDIMLTPLTNKMFDDLTLSGGADLMLESVTLDEIEHAYLGDECVSSDTAMFESISTTRNRLSRTMRAFIRKLNQGLSGTGILAGTNEEGSADGNPSIGGAEIGRVRRVGNIPVLTARIPLSDGQSISIIFHSPTSDGARIKNDDSLTAFRFLLNKRDVSHVVSPVNGRDISLPQVCMSLSNLIERNSSKFQKQAANAAKVKGEIDAELTRTDSLENQKIALIETGDQLQQVLDDKKDELSTLQKRLKKQKEVNDRLRIELEKLKAQQKAKQAPAVASTGANLPDNQPEPQMPEPLVVESEEPNEVDKAASDAIAFLKSVVELETGSTKDLAEVRTKTREAISALNAATVYEENAGLVADAVKRQSQLLATIANTAMAGV
ncbi:internal head protein [Yersinia ruckeri]|uniref:antirestriction phage head protein DarA n=1 Tax=Yersinia ruckeri TaxID=29486 RepID=UPI0020BE498A|nr:internal head protein [Yersinia ruckeri]EKN4689548.1 internal head protein [Yersinia ruckeri]MCK8586573.1 internal head protein [Yersinia ruckeri]MCW6615834.1 internal head protein [Yersinia ruckeri]